MQVSTTICIMHINPWHAYNLQLVYKSVTMLAATYFIHTSKMKVSWGSMCHFQALYCVDFTENTLIV